jgi:teichuronic acid biosynthesis glycosyltransferase TuaC
LYLSCHRFNGFGTGNTNTRKREREMKCKIRSLLFSTLYPSTVRPGHGIFVETRLKNLLASGEVETKVVAPVPWFFSSADRYGRYALMARTPRWENYNGIEVSHPRYLLIPKVGMSVAPIFLALGAIPVISELIADGFDFDLIDAHYYYPDGIAAALLARYFRKPFVVTARGTDISFIPRYAVPRRWILWAAKHAKASIGVCKALKEALTDLGAESGKLHVMRNGVDLDRFHPMPRALARISLGWPDVPTLLAVGNLVELKGHHLIMEALATLPGFRLVIAGAGPERKALESLALKLGISSSVQFAGAVAQSELYMYYSAANVLVLASSREGWANVLLESMACGTPVVATNIWGTPEVVTKAVAGRLASARTPVGLASAIQDLIGDYPQPEAVRDYARGFGWDDTSRAQIDLFRKIVLGQS